MKKRIEDTELLLPSREPSDDEYDMESNRKQARLLSSFNPWPHVFNLSNCIIGVSVLAMPYVFQQCGILLAVLMIGVCSVVNKLTCHFLTHAAFVARRHSYESLALVSLGSFGRRAVELMMLGFLQSCIVAFMVVIGDIGPHVVADYLELEAPTQRLRILVMVLVLLFVIFPLSAIQNLEVFSIVSSAAVFFYAIFVVHMFMGSLPVIWDGVWSMHVSWWRWDGFLVCLPIVAMALSCQTQLFCVMDSMKDATDEHVDIVTSSAINICSGVYASVGLFGYVTYYNREMHGDVLVNLEPTLFTQLLKLAFLLSIAVSIPLMLFPARIALFNLCFRQDSNELPVATLHQSTYHVLTFIILLANLVVAIMVPNVEFILSLTGSVVGSLTSIILPSLMFIAVMKDKNSTSVAYAKVCLIIGITILCLSTMATLQSEQKSQVAERPLPKAAADEQVLKNLERLEEKVLDANMNMSQKLGEVADLAKAGKEKEAERLLLEMREKQKEQEELIKKQGAIVEELKEHVELHHADDAKSEKEKEKEKDNEKVKIEKKEAPVGDEKKPAEKVNRTKDDVPEIIEEPVPGGDVEKNASDLDQGPILPEIRAQRDVSEVNETDTKHTLSSGGAASVGLSSDVQPLKNLTKDVVVEQAKLGDTTSAGNTSAAAA